MIAITVMLAFSAGTAAAAVRTPATVDFASCEKPTWPVESLKKEETGTVHLSFLIGTDGIVKDAKVTQSSGAPLLDQAALEGVRKCRFSPVRLDGKPVEEWQKMQYVWALDIPTEEEERASELMAKKDYAAAAKLLRSAAEKGRADAQYQLAHMLYFGDRVAKDAQEAMMWLKRAAERFHIPAMGAYGSLLLQRGDADEEALHLLHEAAKRDELGAMYLVGWCYESGRGVPINREKARQWYGRANDKGHPQAREALERL